MPACEGKMDISMTIPGSPALPKNSAHTDHRYAAEVPSVIRVSIVAAPCFRFTQVAR